MLLARPYQFVFRLADSMLITAIQTDDEGNLDPWRVTWVTTLLINRHYTHNGDSECNRVPVLAAINSRIIRR